MGLDSSQAGKEMLQMPELYGFVFIQDRDRMQLSMNLLKLARHQGYCQPFKARRATPS